MDCLILVSIKIAKKPMTRSILLLLLISFVTLSQEETYEYLGVIKLNDSAFIPYKLAFENRAGVITGYSLSDLGGKHETKSNLIGSYDEKTDLLTFNEYDIVYTKSPIEELDMCLVHFKGKVRKLRKSKAFSGDFKGKYPDGTSCLNGMIIVSNAQKVEERVAKIDKKVQKSKRVSQEIKDKFSAKRTLDTLTMTTVRNGENLNIFTKSETLTLTIYDSGKVDDDRIQLMVNETVILEDYSIVKEPKEIPITLLRNTPNVITVKALDEGTSAPNTVKVEIQDGERLITTRTSLKTGEVAKLTLVQQ